jgi:hypothetical protein
MSIENKHTKRIEEVNIELERKRMLRSGNVFSVKGRKRSALESGVVDQLQTDESKKRVGVMENVEVNRSRDGADSGVVNQLQTDEIKEKPKTLESGALEQAQMDDRVGGINSSEQMRNFLANSDSTVEGVVPITVKSMVDPEEDQLGTLMRILEGSEEPTQRSKMRTKITVPSYEERQRMRRDSMPLTREHVQKQKKKPKQHIRVDRPYVYPPIDGQPKNRLSVDDERWIRINRLLFHIPITQTVDTRASHTFVDMDYNYHQVHLDIPSLIKNLKENDEARKKLTPEQRNAQKTNGLRTSYQATTLVQGRQRRKRLVPRRKKRGQPLLLARLATSRKIPDGKTRMALLHRQQTWSMVNAEMRI